MYDNTCSKLVFCFTKKYPDVIFINIAKNGSGYGESLQCALQ